MVEGREVIDLDGCNMIGFMIEVLPMYVECCFWAWGSIFWKADPLEMMLIIIDCD